MGVGYIKIVLNHGFGDDKTVVVRSIDDVTSSAFAEAMYFVGLSAGFDPEGLRDAMLDVAEERESEWRDRYADVMAKLARVVEWRGRMPYGVASGAIKDNALAVDDEFDDLDAILSDTSKPLAVVDAWADNDELEEAFSPIQGSVMGLYSRDNGECTPVRVIVMPKEADNG
jgi:hypothetical protein